MTKKTVMMLVLFLLCSSIFAFAQTDDIYDSETVVEECGLGCKVWQFLFGSKEARAGKAWFDRSEALVGEPIEGVTGEKKPITEQEVAKKAVPELVEKIVSEQIETKPTTPPTATSQTSPKKYWVEKNGNWVLAPQVTSTKAKELDPGDKIIIAGNVMTVKSTLTDTATGNLVVITDSAELFYKNGEVDIYHPGEGDVVGAKAKTGAVKLPDVVIKKGTPKAPATGAPTPAAAAAPKKGGIGKEGEKARTELINILGKSYVKFRDSLGVPKDFKKRDDALVMEGKGGIITVREDSGVQVVERSQGGSLLETSLVKDGQILAAQNAKTGVVKVGDSSYNLPKGKKLDASFDELKKGIQLPGKEGPSGFLQLDDQGVLTAVNYEDETFQRITATGTESGKADYYREGSSGCSTKGGCWVPTGGEITLTDAEGKSQSYLTDYEYKGTGADRKKEQIELFDLHTGRKSGIVTVDEKGETDTIITKSDKKTEQGESIYVVKDTKTGTTIKAKKVNDNWRSVSSTPPASLTKARDDLSELQYFKKLGPAFYDDNFKNAKLNLELAYQAVARTQAVVDAGEGFTPAQKQAYQQAKQEYNEAVDKKNKLNHVYVTELDRALAEHEGKIKNAEDKVTEEEAKAKAKEVELSNKLNEDETAEALEELETEETYAGISAFIQSIYSISNNLKSYPAISNLLFGEADFYKSWKSGMDRAFAPLLAETWFTSAICEEGTNHWKDIEPEGKAVIKTTSGTYQAVASIQMERSPEASPILCHKNPDEESDELFICDRRQVCVDDNFCYADQDRDDEPDSKEPLKGYFYKVTWAVSSPQDEALTPLVDENGVAVSFNVFLYPGEVPLYNLNGNIASPIQLQNGASDRDAVIKYSTNVYDHACIRWNQAPITVRFVPGGEEVEDVCFNVVTSEVGKVNWERSGQEAASVTVSHGQLSRNTDW